MLAEIFSVHMTSAFNFASLSSPNKQPSKSDGEKNSIELVAVFFHFSLLLLVVLQSISGLAWTQQTVLEDLINEFRYSSRSAFAAKIELMSYFGAILGRLSLNSDGYYRLDSALKPNAEKKDEAKDLEIAITLFHRGRFNEALSLLDTIKPANGRSEEQLFWRAMSLLQLAQHDSSSRFALDAANTFQLLLRLFKPNDPLYSALAHLSSSFAEQRTAAFSGQTAAKHSNNESAEHTWNANWQDNGSSNSVVPLVERAAALGLDQLDTGKGLAVEDFDADGFLDVVTGASFGTLRFFQNSGGKNFVERTAEVGLDGILQPYTISAADYNNDGWVDLFVTRPFHHFQLFRNEGGRGFRDVTFSSGLLDPSEAAKHLFFSWHSSWADIDNDGDLDLLLTQWGQKAPLEGELFQRPPKSSQLLLNENGKFVDGTKKWNLSRLLRDNNYVASAFGDIDNDGDQDLFLSSFVPGKSRLLINVNGTQFREELSFHSSPGGFIPLFVDVNQDGRLDLIQTPNLPAREAYASLQLDTGHTKYSSRLLLQQASGKFSETDFFRSSVPASVLGVAYGDVDNNGCLDFYLGTGNPESWYITPNLFYLGERKAETCRYALRAQLPDHSQLAKKGQGAVFFDFDNDGDQDLYTVLGGLWPSDKSKNRFYTNQSSSSKNWLRVRLKGQQTNSLGVGARITVSYRDKMNNKKNAHHTMNNKSGFGSAPYLAHFGLSQANSIERVQVYWPVSKKTQEYHVSFNETVELVEDGSTIRKKL